MVQLSIKHHLLEANTGVQDYETYFPALTVDKIYSVQVTVLRKILQNVLTNKFNDQKNDFWNKNFN